MNILVAVFISLTVMLPQALSAAQQAAEREITQIKGDLYRFRNRGHFSVFLVTPAGIIATDPINADAARWLGGEIAKRFNRPIRYLIYSHDHADHISGGEVFADTAIVIAHENAKEVIRNEKRPTAPPNVTFSDRATVELGGKMVELIYLGKNHSDNSIVLRFPDEKVLFGVDFVTVRSMPFRDFPDAYIPEWIESLKKLEALDFDILAPGHGELGNKEDVAALRRYLEQLRSEVSRYLREGKTVEEIKQLVKLEQYKDWGNYERYLPLNIEGMARYIQMFRRPN